MSDGEIRLAWRAFEIVGWPFGPIAQLLLLTGARRDEIASAQWAELELDANIWTIAKERSRQSAIGVRTGLPRCILGNSSATLCSADITGYSLGERVNA